MKNWAILAVVVVLIVAGIGAYSFYEKQPTTSAIKPKSNAAVQNLDMPYYPPQISLTSKTMPDGTQVFSGTTETEFACDSVSSSLASSGGNKLFILLTVQHSVACARQGRGSQDFSLNIKDPKQTYVINQVIYDGQYVKFTVN